MTMREAVQETALKLDRNMPGWEKCIEEQTLNIASSRDCVFGQVYGNFSKGLKRLGIPAGMSAGVSLPMGTKRPREDWIELKALWLEQRDLRLLLEELEGLNTDKAEEMAVV